MKPIARLDGKPLLTFQMPDGRRYVDVRPQRTIDGMPINHGGPFYERHHCRFEDYGLADNLVRCRKCGLVKPRLEAMADQDF